MHECTACIRYNVLCQQTIVFKVRIVDHMQIKDRGSYANYYPFKKYVESEMFFFFSVCCPSVMSPKPLFELSQLQLSCKFTTVGI